MYFLFLGLWMQVFYQRRSIFSKFFLIAFFVHSTAFSDSVFTSDFLTIDLSSAHDCPVIQMTGLFGSFSVTEPVLVELITSPSFARLAKVRQHGNWHYCGQPESYTRFEHSINVFLLVRRFGGDLFEQIAALLHDISHTAFSHSGASFFMDDFIAADHLQDALHETYLASSEIFKILESYGICIADIMPEQDHFIRLEQPLPALCADRIEYNITGGLYEHLLTRAQAEELIDSLRFSSELGCWYFDAFEPAFLFARNSIYMGMAVWTSPHSSVSSKMLGYALRRAHAQGLISRDDVLFGSDDEVFAKMSSSSDALLQTFLEAFQNPEQAFSLGEAPRNMIVCKFRGVNPHVLYEGQIKPLAEVYRPFSWYSSHIQALFVSGWPVSYAPHILEAINSL